MNEIRRPAVLDHLDFARRDAPAAQTDIRSLLVAWLEYQRHEFQRKLRDLTPAQLAARAVPPVDLSVIGLVRHMRQMEHVYLTWGLGGGDRADYYGEDDYTGGSVETIERDLTGYLAEVERSNAAVMVMGSLDDLGQGHHLPLGATLVKMIDEYALHAGQAHMLRFAALGRLQR